MREGGGEEEGGVGREEEGEKEEKKEKNLLSLLCSKFCINAFTCIIVLCNISIKFMCHFILISLRRKEA